jgi:hypothetical protein
MLAAAHLFTRRLALEYNRSPLASKSYKEGFLSIALVCLYLLLHQSQHNVRLSGYWQLASRRSRGTETRLEEYSFTSTKAI